MRTAGHHYFCSKWYTSVHAMTPLDGGAVSRLKSRTRPHFIFCWSPASLQGPLSHATSLNERSREQPTNQWGGGRVRGPLINW